MNRSVNYKTKQSQAILNYIVSLKGTHVTAAQIVGHFEKESSPVSIGRTTVYRHLDKLTEGGEIRRYTTDGISGACYQYNTNTENCQNHLHLKCEECGELKHIECEEMSELQRHVFDKHDFKLNALRTVLYGKCSDCLNK